jgi:hypothetical protein
MLCDIYSALVLFILKRSLRNALSRAPMTTEVLLEATQARRLALARKWDYDDALALLKGAVATASASGPADLAEDVRLVCESLVLHAIETAHGSIEKVHNFIGVPLGQLAAAALPDPLLLDCVLRTRVAWLRLWELAWLMDNDAVVGLLAEGPLIDHPFVRRMIFDTERLDGDDAHLMVGFEWYYDAERETVMLPRLPPAGVDPHRPRSKVLQRLTLRGS